MLQRYARLREDIVIRLHVVSVDAITDEDGNVDYTMGSQLLASLNDEVPDNFIACYRNGDSVSEDGVVALVGWSYDREAGVFRPRQPFPSWVFDSDSWEWNAPVPQPDDGSQYYWDEENVAWAVAEDMPEM